MNGRDEYGVLLVSDTHLRDAARLPASVLEAAERADHIIHAGDHSSLEVVRVLEAFAPVTAVHGNVEDAEVRTTLPGIARVEVGGVRFGVLHDAGPSSGRHERLADRFGDCQVCVYGHSHQPEVTELDSGRWIVNPGSPTQRRQAPTHTFAWAGVRRGRVRIDLVHLTVIACLALFGAGCGDQVAKSQGPSTTPRPAGTTGAATVQAPKVPEPAAPTLALQADHETLLHAMAPVSGHASTVMAAVRLRDRGVGTLNRVRAAASECQLRARTATRTLAKTSRMRTSAGAALRRILVRLARQRAAACQQLGRWAASGGAAAADALALRARFDTTWNASVGTARAGTNLLSASRDAAGLPAKQEDALR